MNRLRSTNLHLPKARILAAFLWRITLQGRAAQLNSEPSRDWQAILRWLAADPTRREKLKEQMAQPLGEVFLWILTESPQALREQNPQAQADWHGLKRQFGENEKLAAKVAEKAADFLFQFAVKPVGKKENIIVQPRSKQTVIENKQNDNLDLPPNAETAVDRQNEAGAAENAVDKAAENTAPSVAPPASLWKYLPVPQSLEPHSEFDSRAGRSPEGWHIVGARVRGKKHKHEGTNCDDWFEFGTSGAWTILAVADGAGSRKFSRVGAHIACQSAVQSLAAELAEQRIATRAEWTPETFVRRDDGEFLADDLNQAQTALHGAMRHAYNAIRAATAERAADELYRAELERDLEVEDLSATLLLAIHMLVPDASGETRSFVLSCQIGDGMIGAVDCQGGLRLLGLPDKGEYAGQTDFLSSEKKLGELHTKTFGMCRPLRALMLMTDGVADDYYPNDPELLRLYGDLVLNRIVEANTKDAAPNESFANVSPESIAQTVERITADGGQQIVLQSAAAFAEQTGISFAAASKHPALLLSGVSADADSLGATPEERLSVWLDSYQVRGSFDDRTLLILHRSDKTID